MLSAAEYERLLEADEDAQHLAAADEAIAGSSKVSRHPVGAGQSRPRPGVTYAVQFYAPAGEGPWATYPKVSG